MDSDLDITPTAAPTGKDGKAKFTKMGSINDTKTLTTDGEHKPKKKKHRKKGKKGL